MSPADIPDRDLEERLAQLEPPYRSRGEAQVGRLLDRYGMPFVYEQPTAVQVYGQQRIWYPDFTLPTYDNLIVEYAGMPDRPDYMTGVQVKQQVYAANDIPAVFLYPDDLNGPNWPTEVCRTIVTAYSNASHEYHRSQ